MKNCISSKKFEKINEICCPRCDAIGKVFIDDEASNNYGGLVYRVQWYKNSKMWSQDVNVISRQLTKDFGCGYDGDLETRHRQAIKSGEYVMPKPLTEEADAT